MIFSSTNKSTSFFPLFLQRLLSSEAWLGTTLIMPSPALFKRPKEGLQVLKVTDETVDQETRMMGGAMFLATQDVYERISRELSRGTRFHRDKWRSYLKWVARRGNAYRTICCSGPADDYTFEHFLGRIPKLMLPSYIYDSCFIYLIFPLSIHTYTFTFRFIEALSSST